MIRRLILRPPHSIVFLAFVVMILPTPAARAQDRADQDRLDRLERDLSMLQRQVYRGGLPVVALGREGRSMPSCAWTDWRPRCAN